MITYVNNMNEEVSMAVAVQNVIAGQSIRVQAPRPDAAPDEWRRMEVTVYGADSYRRRTLKKGIEVNWSAMGSQDTATTRVYVSLMLSAIQIAEMAESMIQTVAQAAAEEA